MPNVTSETTIEKLRDMFIPERLVSDNRPQFTSSEFATFMKRNGIKHILVAPYHPRSNGQAERVVQTFKQFFKAEGKTSASLRSNLARFLFGYRVIVVRSGALVSATGNNVTQYNLPHGQAAGV